MLGTMFKVMLGGGEGKNAMLDTILEQCDRKVFGLDDLVPPPPDADARNPFTSTVPADRLSIATLSVAQRLKMMPIMMGLMRQMGRSARLYERPIVPRTDQADPALFDAIDALAREHGATAVRYVTLPDDCIFEGKAVPHRNAVVYTVQMDKLALDTAPSFEAFLEVARGYRRLAVVGNRVAALMRSHGHTAYPGTALGGLTDYPRVAELAGLGAIGYHGLLISRSEGALLRLNTIYTSIQNLPVTPTDEYQWVREFCSRCRKCIRSCPVDAIHPAPIVQDNGRVQCIDSKTCLDYFAQNHGCAICADVCPFSQKGFDAIETRFAGNPSAPRYHVPAQRLHTRGAMHH